MKAYEMGITKADFLAEIKRHMELDNFIKGHYSEGVKGCAVGCSIKSINRLKKLKIPNSTHSAYETHLGIPEWLARLQDCIFEGLPDHRHKKWPLEFSEAINEGADLDKIKIPFIIFVLSRNIEIQQENLEYVKDDELKRIINDVIESNRMMIDAHQDGNESFIESAASAARSAESAASAAASAAESAARSAWSAASARSAAWSAWSAAWSAAESAASAAESAWSAAESAARSAARSAESAARSAWSAAWSAESAARSARSAAESARSEEAAYELYADELLRLMRECN